MGATSGALQMTSATSGTGDGERSLSRDTTDDVSDRAAESTSTASGIVSEMFGYDIMNAGLTSWLAALSGRIAVERKKEVWWPRGPERCSLRTGGPCVCPGRGGECACEGWEVRCLRAGVLWAKG